MKSTLAIIVLGLAAATVAHAAGPVFRQIWAENFTPCSVGNALCMNGLNATTWGFELGDGTKYGPYLAGWGNNELQCYTNRSQNVRVASSAYGATGVLLIEANFEQDGFTCYNPGAASSTRWWTSARLITRGKAAFAPTTQPIKVEARVRIPTEWGAWPAFWMLPNTPREDCLACGDYGNGWCTSGEIDIMEARNRDGVFKQVLHYGGLKDQSWLDCKQAMVDTNASAALPNIYWTRVSVVWGPANISFYVNDTLTQTVPQSQWYTGSVDKTAQPRAPFDKPFYLLLNLAVGGNFPATMTGGNAVTDTRKLYRYAVDYIKVFEQV